MSIDEAVELVRKQYENDIESAYIVNPVAHALYEVWKKADREKSYVPRMSFQTDRRREK